MTELLARLLLTVQRTNVRVPAVVAAPLRRMLQSSVKRQLEALREADWSGNRGDRAYERIQSAVTQHGASRPAGAGSPVPAPSTAAGGALSLQPRIRCMLVTSSLDAGGMDEVVAFLARRLPEQGVHTAVLHTSERAAVDGVPSGRLGRLLLQHGVESRELNASAATGWLELWRPDVISAHGAPSWVLDAATRLGIPYVKVLHGMHTLFSTDWAQEAQRSRRMAGIVSVSELLRNQYLAGNPGFPSEKIVTIANANDEQRRTGFDREQVRSSLGLRKEYLFVSLARHCLQKNSYALVAAFAKLAEHHPDIQLVIAGRVDDAGYFGQMLQLRRKLPCEQRIHFCEHVADPGQLLAAADGFVLDSFFEGYPLSSLEALCAGVPVVISEVGGAAEQINADARRGYMVPNPLGDPLLANWDSMRAARFAVQSNRAALVDAMSRLVAERAERLADRARLMTESEERFRADTCLERHALTLAAAVSGKSSLHGSARADAASAAPVAAHVRPG
jgi:glycosyltransferase involved in cell wall biosynthesis